MALSSSRLAASMKAKMLDGATNAVDNAALTAMCEALATAIVEEITGNASVVPTAMTAGGDPVVGTGSVQ